MRSVGPRLGQSWITSHVPPFLRRQSVQVAVVVDAEVGVGGADVLVHGQRGSTTIPRPMSCGEHRSLKGVRELMFSSDLRAEAALKDGVSWREGAAIRHSIWSMPDFGNRRAHQSTSLIIIKIVRRALLYSL